MDGKYLLLLSCMLASPGVFAEACHVHSQSSSAQVSTVDTESCYEYRGMPDGAIDWSCSNESKEMLSTDKRKVAKCAEGSVGSCIAQLTQETLANPKSMGRDEPATRPAIGKEARVITYYYDTPSLGQARTDCERSNGIWQTH